MTLDIKHVCDILLQRFPILMVDRVMEFEKGKRISAIKNVSINESFFQGHFPDHPIMPGVLIIEAMAQTSALLLSLTNEDLDYKKNKLLFASVNKMRFLNSVLPGDQMIIEVESIKLTSFAGIVSAQVRVEDRVVAKGELSFGASNRAV